MSVLASCARKSGDSGVDSYYIKSSAISVLVFFVLSDIYKLVVIFSSPRSYDLCALLYIYPRDIDTDLTRMLELIADVLVDFFL